MALSFEARYYPERLRILNPTGDVGVATLWTPVKTALDVLERVGVDLDPASSRVAVIANLYGDGLPQLIRNLLWNPQIRHLLVFGQDLSGSGPEIEALLTKGVETVERWGHERFRIFGTDRLLDTGFDPDLLVGRYAITRLGQPGKDETKQGLADFFAALPPQEEADRDRVFMPLPEFKPTFYPSEPRGHVVVRPRPLDAWEEVVFRVMRFGIPHTVSRVKKRIELQNLKVVVTDPAPEADEHLRPYGFTLADMEAYQRKLLDGSAPETHYSYGNRMRAHWAGGTLDTLVDAARRLREDPTTRDAYITLWDPNVDMTAGEDHSAPCLTTLFFRHYQDRLTLTATFRAHNTMSAWLKNVYGLMAVQAFVARETGGLETGAITVISHSISIDPDAVERYDLAQQIVRAKEDDLQLDRETGKRELREDPHGYFAITLDEETGEIVADHKIGGDTLTRYRGRTAQEIEKQIARDEAISLISHALYVGRELTRQEARLKEIARKRPETA